jgi:mRNA guanylyltransferase
MYFSEDQNGAEMHYLIDRRNDYYYVPELHFPVPADPSFQNFHRDTITDGELVNDILPNGSTQLKYLVFDCLMLDGNSLMHRTLDKRLAYFRDKVYKPYKVLYEQYPEEIQHLPFVIEFKKMELGYGIEMMFRDILPTLPHGNDGLIFTCRNSPYKFGTDEHILKWKPENENSIDFRLNLVFPPLSPDSEASSTSLNRSYQALDFDAHPIMNLSAFYGSGDDRPFAELYMTPEDWAHLKSQGIPLEDAVVECAQDSARRWRFLRMRDDKKEANHISTVNAVLESINDRVSEGDLIRAAKSIRDQWKERERRAKLAERGTNGSGVNGGGAAGSGVSGSVKRKADEVEDEHN